MACVAIIHNLDHNIFEVYKPSTNILKENISFEKNLLWFFYVEAFPQKTWVLPGMYIIRAYFKSYSNIFLEVILKRTRKIVFLEKF